MNDQLKLSSYFSLWHPTQSIYGNWQLEKSLEGPGNVPVSVFYDPDRKLVVNTAGKQIWDVEPPPQQLIDFLHTTVASSRPSPSIIIDGMIYHQIFPQLIFDRASRSWIDTVHQTKVSGLPHPPEVIEVIL
jgi:hypothetical protein